MISNKKVMNTKVVQIIKIYNFYLGHIVIWHNLRLWNLKFLKNDEFKPKLETQNDFNIKSDEYQSCSNHQDLQLCCWPFLNLIKFECLKFEIFKNDKFEPKFETQNDFNIKSDEYQSCSTHQDLQILCWPFLHLTKFKYLKFWKRTSSNWNLRTRMISK